MFLLYAEKNQLAVREKEPITSGSVNVYPVQFEFSEDWDGLDRTAVFQAGCRKRAVALAGGVCSVPAEVLSEPGYYLMAGVCGENGEGAVLPTIWANLGLILAGASTGDAPEPEPPPEGGTTDHRRLSHRDALEQHPIASISGLEKELNRIPEPVEALTNTELEEMLK